MHHPRKNFQYGTFKEWDGGIHEEFKEKYFVKKKACGSCPVGCGRASRVEEPCFGGEGEGPEYETLAARVEAMAEASGICISGRVLRSGCE